MVMYIGSVDPATNGSLIFAWKNNVLIANKGMRLFISAVAAVVVGLNLI